MIKNQSILIKNAKEILGILSEPYSFKKGKALSQLDGLKDGFLLIENGLIKDFGPMAECSYSNVDEIIDAKERMVLPSWVDSHTHIVYATSREEEFVMRIQGKSYEEIAEAGGGILNSAKKLANATEGDLYKSAHYRLKEMISFGTGAIEIKSGYGLSFESELKMLRVIKKLKAESDATIKATFLGAHAIPLKYKSNRSAYIKLLTEEMLPAIAEQELADYCDVFCDEGFFTVEETDIILKRATSFGLKPKIHANELAISGGVQVGIKNKAISVDHLERIGDEEIEALLNANTIPTLLPGTSYFLGIPFAPARKMIDAGLGIALATDYNPGSTPSGNMPFLMSLACTQMKMTPKECINAVTINAAHALELGQELGSISRGKKANVIITEKIKNIEYIPYAYGSKHIHKIILKGIVQ